VLGYPKLNVAGYDCLTKKYQKCPLLETVQVAKKQRTGSVVIMGGCYKLPPWRMNIESKNGALKDDCPFSVG